MYVEVNGINLYYKKTECVKCHENTDSPAIILLHGNGEDHSIFNKLTEKLANNYTVYGIDSRNHGKSRLTNNKSSASKNISYNDIAKDVAVFINKMGIKKPIIYGFSDGGIVALIIGINNKKWNNMGNNNNTSNDNNISNNRNRNSNKNNKYNIDSRNNRYNNGNLVSKLIIAGANIRPNGIKRFWINIYKIQAYLTFNREKRKNLMMMLKEPNISNNELKQIEVDTLVLAGEKDVITYEHSEEIASNIKNSYLKILDNENHYSYIVNSDKSYEIVIDFLNNTKTTK